MKIAGFKKHSLIDFPGYISSVIFTQGCNFRCGFCHNPDLVLPARFSSVIDESVILDYLQKRKNLLGGVCITGGEPTIHKDLPNLIRWVKNLGLKVKLDSNGTNPDMLRSLIDDNLVDYIAMDIKHLLNYDDYNRAAGYFIHKSIYYSVLNSINIIRTSKINHEFRTTVMAGLHNLNDIKELKQQFPDLKIQNFNDKVVMDPDLNIKAFSDKQIEDIS